MWQWSVAASGQYTVASILETGRQVNAEVIDEKEEAEELDYCPYRGHWHYYSITLWCHSIIQIQQYETVFQSIIPSGWKNMVEMARILLANPLEYYGSSIILELSAF